MQMRSTQTRGSSHSAALLLGNIAVASFPAGRWPVTTRPMSRIAMTAARCRCAAHEHSRATWLATSLLFPNAS